MPVKLTFEDVKHLFEDVRGFQLLETTYVNAETPMRYVCTCGNIGFMSYKNAKKGRSCKECGRIKLSRSKQIYTYEYIREFFEIHDCLLLEDEYNGDPHYRMKYVCKCGTESRTSWSDFKDGHRCKTCRTQKAADARRKYSIDEVRQLFAAQGKTLLEDEFFNSLQPLRYICRCGNESSITLNNFLKGKDCYQCRNKKISELMKDPNITDEERLVKRNVPEIKQWRDAVFARDGYTCQCCGGKGKMNAHHIFNYADHKQLRFDVSNGITLCVNCHVEFHRIYGVRNTNQEQLNTFINQKRITGVV